MKIPPFKELNPPDNLGYWTNKSTGEKYGGQYISPLLIPNLKKVEAGFKKAMKKFNVKDIGDMSDDDKKDFFNYVDRNYKAKNEIKK